MADSHDQHPAPPSVTAAFMRQVPVVYFNTALAQATDYELSLDLGYRAGGNDADVAVRVITSWEHAKRLRALLDRLIDLYEEQAGPIRDFPNEPLTGGSDDADS